MTVAPRVNRASNGPWRGRLPPTAGSGGEEQIPVVDERADLRQRRGHELLDGTVQQLRPAPPGSGAGSARRRWRRPPPRPGCRPGGPAAAHAAGAPRSLAGSAAPGSPVRLLDHVRPADPRRWRAGRASLRPASRSTRSSQRADRRAQGLLDGVRPVLQPGHRALPLGPAQGQPAEPDPLDALLGEPRQPGVVALDVVGPAVDPGVAQPQLDVLRGVERPRAAPPTRRSRCRRPTRPAAPPTAAPPRAPSWPAPAPRRRGPGGCGASVTTRRTTSSPGSPESR